MAFHRVAHGVGPYQQQPPSGIQPRGVGLTHRLLYSSAVPYEAVHSTKHGWSRLVPANGTAAATGRAPTLGKTLVTSSALNNPLQADNLLVPTFPISVMVNFRLTSTPVQGTMISFGGSGTGNGWAFSADTAFTFTMGGVANYVFTMPVALAIDRDYTAILVVTGNVGTATVYWRDRLSTTAGQQVTNAMTIGTMLTPVRPLTLGGAHNAGSGFVDPFNGAVGSFAVWERILSANEIYSLLENPYQLWAMPRFGRPATTNNDATPDGVSATSALGDVTVSGGGSVVPTGLAATGAVGLVSIGTGVNVSPDGFEATASLGVAGAEVGTVVYIEEGFVATAYLGEVEGVAGFVIGCPAAETAVGSVAISSWNAIVSQPNAAWTEISGG